MFHSSRLEYPGTKEHGLQENFRIIKKSSVPQNNFYCNAQQYFLSFFFISLQISLWYTVKTTNGKSENENEAIVNIWQRFKVRYESSES